MKKSQLLTCLAVAFFGLLSAVLGLVAEAKKTRLHQVGKTADGRCEYPTSAAFGLGIAAAASLFVSQVIVNVAAGCLCCAPLGPTSTKCKRTAAIISLVVSWITFVLAFLILLNGAVSNSGYTSDVTGADRCYVAMGGVFTLGVVLGIVTMTFGIIYYITTSSVKSATSWGTQNQSIGMAQPSQVLVNAPPVFVPENTCESYGYPQDPPTASPNFQRQKL